MTPEEHHALMEVLICDGGNLLFQLRDFSPGFLIAREDAFNNLPGSQELR